MKKRLLMTLFMMAMAVNIVACGAEESEEVSLEQDTSGALETNDSGTTADDTDTTDDVVIEVIDGFSYSDEYLDAYEADSRIGANYTKTGEAEVSEFDDWKEAYETLIEDVSDNHGNAEFALIYVDDDEIPELVYTSDDGKYIVAAFTGDTVNLFSSQLSSVAYIKNANVLYAHEKVEASLYDYVVALRDGYWVEIATGINSPLDEWAEDSFDENGNPIISYWELNGEELSSQNEYDTLLAKYCDKSYLSEVNDFKSADDTISAIEAL